MVERAILGQAWEAKHKAHQLLWHVATGPFKGAQHDSTVLLDSQKQVIRDDFHILKLPDISLQLLKGPILRVASQEAYRYGQR